jgi:hypothetical protein
MFAKGVLPIVLVLSLLAIVPSAGATSYVQFSLSDPEVTYINFGSAKEIFINNLNYVDAASTMSVEIRDDISHKLLDSTSLLTNGLDGYTESFLADLTFTSNSPTRGP